jgi:two-component system, cell cycle response regulator
MNGNAWQRQDLVPLSQRLHLVQLYRATAVTVAAGLASWTGAATTGPRITAIGVGALVAFQLAALAVRRSERLGRRLFGLVLLVDGVLLATLVHLLGGLSSPGRYLVVLHVVLVTLVASYRTGVKLVIWHSLLALVHTEAAEIGWLTVTDVEGAGAAVVTQIALLCSATVVTAAASAVNEREILRRRYDLEALAQMSADLEGSSNLHEITDTLLAHLCATFDLPRALVVSLRHDDLAVIAGRGVAPAPGGAPVAGTLALVAAQRRPVFAAALGAGDSWLDTQLPDAHNLMLVPLAPDGEVDDVLVMEHPRAFTGRLERRVSSTIERFAAHGALAMRNARLHAELVAHAQTDGLTGVANRMTFDRTLAEELSRVDRQHGSLSLILCDLDHFKHVNDTYGHQLGDEVLIETARLLQTHTRTYDLVARYGGEEFAIVLPDTDQLVAIQLADRLRTEITEGVTSVSVTMSLGVSTVTGGAVDAGALIGAADEALYAAKRGGRDRVSFADVLAPGPLAVGDGVGSGSALAAVGLPVPPREEGDASRRAPRRTGRPRRRRRGRGPGRR